MASHTRPHQVRADIFQGSFAEVGAILAPGVTTSTLTVSGPTTLQAATATFLSVASAVNSASVNTGSVTASGPVLLGSTLTVTGATTLAGVGATSLSVSGALGATTLGVSGASTLAAVSAASLSVSGAAALGATTATSVTTTTLGASGVATLNTANVTTLSVSGTATFDAGLVVPTGQALVLQGTAAITAAGAGSIALASGTIATGGALQGGSATVIGALGAGSAAVTGALTAGSVATTAGSITTTTGTIQTTLGRVLAPNLGPFGHSSAAPQALGDVFPMLVVPSGRTMLIVADSSLLTSANPNAPGFPQLTLIRTVDETCDHFTVFNNSRYPLELVGGVGAETATDKQIAAYAVEYNPTGNIFWPTTAMDFYRDMSSGRWIGVSKSHFNRSHTTQPALVINSIVPNGQIRIDDESVLISAGMGTTATGQCIRVVWDLDWTVTVGATVPAGAFTFNISAPWQSVTSRWTAQPYPWMELPTMPVASHVGTGWLISGTEKAARLRTSTATNAIIEHKPQGATFQEAQTGELWSVALALEPVINVPATL